jgi:alanine racemase|tara:strand:+ start:2445 stop:3521 length:1077 start_codon:yes stop_codon:yes gene_type:complete
MRSTKAEINLSNLRKNINYLKSMVDKNVEILAIVKANAYGHGSIRMTKALIENDIKSFGVATLQEANEIINSGISCNILILGSIGNDEIIEAINKKIIFTIYDIKQLEFVNQLNTNEVTFHLKIDTGMNRLGISVKEIEESLKIIKSNKKLNLQGVYTHFPESDNVDSDFTLKQINEFNTIIDLYKKNIQTIKYFHSANSSAIINFKSSHFNMVRPGILMYGLGKSGQDKLSPVMSLKTEVVKIRKIKAKESVSYGRTFVAEKNMTIGVIPIGYADGLPRSVSNLGHVICRDVKCKILGRVCMDLTMIDLTSIVSPKLGDEVIIFDDLYTANHLSSIVDTISYEIVCGISKRVNRIYL